MSGAPAPEATLEGHYAGVASRIAALVIDSVLSFWIFTIMVAAGRYVIDLVFDTQLEDDSSLLWGVGLVLWLFLYYWYCWGMAGKTPGAALLGIRVVRQDGHELGFGRAFVRTIVFPLSFALAGLGFLGALVGRQRRTLHDVAARSTVVYDWDTHAARLRFLARRSA